MTITRAGYELAFKLNPYIGTTEAIAETVSLIRRHAVSLDHIQVRWCNDDMGERATAALEKREAQLEARIRHLTALLPETDDGPIAVQFDGDPRGFTTRFVLPDGREIGVA